MNLVIYTEAQDKTASAVVSMTDTTPLTELEQLVLGDTPLISVTFTDGSAAPAWAGQSGYTMSLALGTPDGDGRLDYTQIQAETAITGGWEGNLPLDTPALVTALNLLVNQGATILRPPTQRYTYQAPRFAWFVLQIAVRGPDGYLTTYASLRVCVLNRVITSNFSEQQSADAEVFAWTEEQLALKQDIRVINYVFEGDSLTATAGDNGVGATNVWPARFEGMIDALDQVTFTNNALSGDTIELIVGEYATEVYPYRPINPQDISVLFVWAGTNDIGNGRTASNIYTNLQAEWAQARADGFVVVAFTLLPRTDFTVGNGRETVRLAVNALIRSDTSLFDALIEPDVYLATATDTTLFSDGIHKTAIANRMVAQDVYETLYGGPGTRHDILSGFNASLVGDVTAIDSIERAISRLQNVKLALTGGTMSGTLTGTTINATTSSIGALTATTSFLRTGAGDVSANITTSTSGSGSASVLFTTPLRNGSFGVDGAANQFYWYGLGSTLIATLNGSGVLNTIGGFTATGQAAITAAEPQFKAVASSGSTTPSIEFRDAAGTPNVWRIGSGFGSATDGVMYVYDFRQGLVRMTVGTDGLVTVKQKFKVDGNVGFNGTTPPAKPTVTGSRGGNAALASLLTALASTGLLTDSTTA